MESSRKSLIDYAKTNKQGRLSDAREAGPPWKKWGPYLSERQWGTVREDYSKGGDAWNYFTHDHTRSRAYRWGEDGIVRPGAGLPFSLHPALTSHPRVPEQRPLPTGYPPFTILIHSLIHLE
jgi:hypothetical protein